MLHRFGTEQKEQDNYIKNVTINSRVGDGKTNFLFVKSNLNSKKNSTPYGPISSNKNTVNNNMT